MAWDGNGTYTRDNGTNTGASLWSADAAAAIKITTANHDLHDENIATAINACLTKNMETKPTADFVPNVTDTYDLGTTALKWEDLHLNGAATIGGAVTATGVVSSGGNALRPAVTGTVTATTSGTAPAFTGLPATITHFTMMFNTVSASDTVKIRLHLGDATTGGYVTTNYVNATAEIDDSANPSVTNFTTGIFFTSLDGTAANAFSGAIDFYLLDATNFIYVYSGNLAETSGALTSIGGKVTLAGLVDRVRLYIDGADTFDNGSFNIRYE